MRFLLDQDVYATIANFLTCFGESGRHQVTGTGARAGAEIIRGRPDSERAGEPAAGAKDEAVLSQRERRDLSACRHAVAAKMRVGRRVSKSAKQHCAKSSLVKLQHFRVTGTKHADSF